MTTYQHGLCLATVERAARIALGPGEIAPLTLADVPMTPREWAAGKLAAANFRAVALYGAIGLMGAGCWLLGSIAR